jgi:hypothetical protein
MADTYYRRRESVRATELTADDLDTLPKQAGAKVGDFLVVQLNQPPRVMTADEFREHYEPADGSDDDWSKRLDRQVDAVLPKRGASDQSAAIAPAGAEPKQP